MAVLFAAAVHWQLALAAERSGPAEAGGSLPVPRATKQHSKNTQPKPPAIRLTKQEIAHSDSALFFQPLLPLSRTPLPLTQTESRIYARDLGSALTLA